MKFKLFFLSLFLSICFTINGQPQKKEISHYVFSVFQSGTALMTDGTRNPAMLNFNTATEEMVFRQNEEILAFADVTLTYLDTVIIGDRRFVLLNNQFMEVINEDDFKLFVQHKCRITPPGKTAAYGGTSQLQSSTTYSSWTDNGMVYHLHLPDDYKVTPYKIYWFDDGSGWKSFSSLSQIKRFYNKQRSEFNKYTQVNKVEFENMESVTALFQAMGTDSK